MLRFLKNKSPLANTLKNPKIQTIHLRHNHYTLFNLPQTFKLDEKRLKKAYLQLQCVQKCWSDYLNLVIFEVFGVKRGGGF